MVVQPIIILTRVFFFYSSTLTYAPHSPQEYGSIECRGKNDVGLQQKPCKYQIIPAGEFTLDTLFDRKIKLN